MKELEPSALSQKEIREGLEVRNQLVNHLIPSNCIRSAQPVVILPLDEYNLLKKKVDEAETAISYAEEIGRLLSLLDDLGGMSEKMKTMIMNGKQLFK